jgi:hypothetical protein
MAKPWKTPMPLRLRRVEMWRKERFQRPIRSGDTSKAVRAANLYTATAARASTTALAMVNGYDDRN